MDCFIPCRIGSERFKKKNLALIDGKPILAWGIENAISSGVFSRIRVSGDSEKFEEIARSYSIEYIDRDKYLAQSNALSDDVIADYIRKHKPDYMCWMNAIAPLTTQRDIVLFSQSLESGRYESLFTVDEIQVQCNFDGDMLNYRAGEKFSKTQDLKTVQAFVPSLMGWNCSTFMESYDKHGHGMLHGRLGFQAVDRLTSLVIKKESDFRLVRSVVEGIGSIGKDIEYYG